MKANKIILIGLLTGLIALNAVSVSLAWYSASNRLAIEAIDIRLDGDRELLISTSTDLDSFKEELSYDELHEVQRYFPVSTMYQNNWLNVEGHNEPIFYDSSYTTLVPFDEYGTPRLVESHGGYFYQEVYLFSEDNVYVTIKADDTEESATYIKQNALFNNAYAQEVREDEIKRHEQNENVIVHTEEEIRERLANLPNAMRFSILCENDEGNYDYAVVDPNHNEEEVLLGGILDNTFNHKYDHYNKNDEKFEVVYGEVNDRSKIIYDEAFDADSTYEGEPNVFNASHEAGVKRFNLEQSLANGVEIAKEQRYIPEDFKQSDVKFFFPVKANTPTKVGVALYIEGWDLDSVNQVMGAGFKAGLSFRIYRDMEI
ncbi:MAG: hypothetical protein K5925_05170 [Bacilli bacterium]|nr:hypothetical protein [Bacilli bacterium]